MVTILFLTILYSGSVSRPGSCSGVSIRVYTGLVGDGSMAPFYADVKRTKGVPVVLRPEQGIVTLLPAHTRRGERGVLAFFEAMVERGTLSAGDVVVTDNENCWKTDLVETYLSHHDITHILYPTHLGALLDPCDNSFHARVRHAYDKAVFGKTGLNLQKRIEIVCKLHRATPTQQVQAFIRHCGLFEGDPEHVMHELMCEGRGVLGKRRYDLYETIRDYLAFQKAFDFSEPDEQAALKRLKGAPLCIVHKSRGKARK